MADKPKLLYWDVGKSTFVRKDLKILSEHFRIADFTFDTKRKQLYPWQFFLQFFRCLFHLPGAAAVVCQFAGFHSYIPFVLGGIFRVKRVVVAGGTDCVAFPSISYGNFQRPYLKWFTRKTFELADLILPVHETLIDYAYNYTGNDFPRQGYRNFTGRIKAREVVIWNGYDSAFWSPRDVQRKPHSFITVGADLHSRFAFRLKGIDLYLELAKQMPDCEFAIVGGKGIDPEKITPNVRLLANVPNEQLPELYSSYTYYVQLSLSEGFPNALTEAVLCGCIPIVSAVGAMPMIVRHEENILRTKSIEELLKLVGGLESQQEHHNYREYIATHFTEAHRSQQLTGELLRGK